MASSSKDSRAMYRSTSTLVCLCFSNKTFQRLPADLQAAILQAGKDAGTYGRILESSEDIQKLLQMQSEGKLKTVYFKERDALVKAAEPVIQDYFKENNASEVLQNILNAQ
jgi:TRAP-type C4-dicarboxylate transport system substrate-binding protein